MSVMKRLSGIVQAKANKALDKAENPADMLDLTYSKQLGTFKRYAAPSPTWQQPRSGSSCKRTN